MSSGFNRVEQQLLVESKSVNRTNYTEPEGNLITTTVAAQRIIVGHVLEVEIYEVIPRESRQICKTKRGSDRVKQNESGAFVERGRSSLEMW